VAAIFQRVMAQGREKPMKLMAVGFSGHYHIFGQTRMKREHRVQNQPRVLMTN